MKKQFQIITLFTLLAFSTINAVAQSNSQSEKLTIKWPKEEGWHIVNQHDNANSTVTMMVLLKDKETIENHNEIGTTYICRGSMYVPIEKKIEEFFQPLKHAPTAKTTIIEKDEKAKFPWVILKIESPTESQIWYAIQGKNELYCTLWSTKQKEITPESQEKWVGIFKSSEIIAQ